MDISIRKILAPTDLSEPSLCAVRYAHSLAGKLGAELTLLHVVQDLALVLPDALMPNPTPAPAIDDFVDNAKTHLAELIQREGLGETRVEVKVGTPYSEICAFAEKHDSDLIIIHTHGRTGLAHVLLGSVAERIVRHAPCPVLTVRGDCKKAGGE